ncbi:MAG: lysine exporter LysO family protein, partial [Rikenellaceae bacterium]
YYSLSTVIITNAKGAELGTIALVANILREVLTILLAPLFVKVFGKLAPIASGASTTMDITLPSIVKFSGKEYAVLAIFNGIVLSFVVPILVSFFVSF